MLPSFVVRACRDQDRAGVVACINGSAQDNLYFEISIGRPPPPPVVFSIVAASHSEGEEEGVERLQGGCSICELAVDLALVQKPVRAPNKTPLQAVGHRITSPDEGSALAHRVLI